MLMSILCSWVQVKFYQKVSSYKAQKTTVAVLLWVTVLTERNTHITLLWSKFHGNMIIKDKMHNRKW